MLYKILKNDEKNYLYDAYDNYLVEIDETFCQLVKQHIINSKYLKYLKSYKLRNIFEEKVNFKYCSCLDKTQYRWKCEHSQKQLVLSLTEKCNLRCSYCVFHNDRYHSKELVDMNQSTLEKALSQFLLHSNETDIIYISFYGGEPLLCFDTLQFSVNFVTEHHLGQKVQYTITTNGLLLEDKEILKFLINKNFIIVVSLDGPKEIHDECRKDIAGHGTYDRVITNLKYIKKNYPEFYSNNLKFNAVVSYTAPKELADFYPKDKVSFMEMEITPWFNTENPLLAEKVRMFQTNKKDEGKDLKLIRKIHSITRDSTHIISLPCGYCEPGERKIYVTTTGKLYPCEKVDEVDNYSIGNVEKWVDFEKVQSLLDKTMNLFQKNCLNCWAFRICPMCFASEKEIDFEGEKCIRLRNKIEDSFKIYFNQVNNNIYLNDYMNNSSAD